MMTCKKCGAFMLGPRWDSKRDRLVYVCVCGYSTSTSCNDANKGQGAPFRLDDDVSPEVKYEMENGGCTACFCPLGSRHPGCCIHRDPAKVLGRRGGLKGGKARAEKLSPERRSEIARNAALKRWEAEQC